MPLKLDSHQHFWKYSDAEYGWIDDPVLRRDFLPENLHKELAAAKIDGSISVQARQTIAETEWLLSLADQYKFLRGVVGWVPLTLPSVEADIEKFASRKKLKAVRHVVQDETDDPLRRPTGVRREKLLEVRTWAAHDPGAHRDGLRVGTYRGFPLPQVELV